MKKLVLTAVVLMGFATGTYAQYSNRNCGGLFGLGSTPDGQMRGWSDDGFLFFPGHASWGNWNSDPDGWTDYPPDPVVPVGGGTLLLIGFGAAYAMKIHRGMSSKSTSSTSKTRLE